MKRKGAQQRYNLKMMRQHMPARDADSLNLGIKPLIPPAYDIASRRAYVVYKMFPDTLDELNSRLGVHGEAGVMDTLWSTVSRWLMNCYGTGALSNPQEVANLAVKLCRAHDRQRLGYPAYSSKPATMVLDDLNEDNRQEAMRVAAETIVHCQRAGMLVASASDIKFTYQIVTSIAANMAASLALNSKDTAE